MLIANIAVTILIPIAAFGAIAVAAWVVMDMFFARKSRAEERVDQLGRDGRLLGVDSNRTTAGNMARAFESASPKLAQSLQPKNEKEANKLKLKLGYAGYRGENASSVFLASKFMGLLVGAFVGGGIFLLTTGFTTDTAMRTFFCAGVMFYLPEIFLWWKTKKRKEVIFLGLPDALDLMVVCVEAGLGLDQAMRKVTDEMAQTYPALSEEFGIANMQLQMGRPRTEVLSELGERSGVDDLKALASIIIQADKFGSSIAQALRVQSESMRTRRKQIAEEKAAKTAVQLIFPLVLFIFPGIFVVLVGPAAITMINEMLPMMNGTK